MGLTKILDGSVEQGSVTIENPEISVAIDAANDSIKVGAQAGGTSGRYNQDISTAVAPAWGSANNFGFETQAILMQNKGDEDIEISFDGVSVDSTLESSGAASAKSFDNRHETAFYVRSVSGSKTVRVEAW